MSRVTASSVLKAVSSRPARWLFALLAVGLAVWALARDWDDVRAALGRLDAATLAAAAAATALYVGASAQIWWASLADLGSRLPLWPCARIFLVAQLGKYVPGSLWPVVVQAEMARDQGVPRGRSITAGIVTMLVQVASGAVVVLAALPVLPGVAGAVPAALVMLGLPLVLLHPAVLGRVADRALAAARAEPLALRTSLRGTGSAMAWGVASWLFAGAQLWVVARALGAPSDARTLLVCIGAYAVAWVVGSAVFVAPAGAGAREVTLALALSGVLGEPEALAAVLVSRVLLTLGDLAGAALGLGARTARVGAAA